MRDDVLDLKVCTVWIRIGSRLDPDPGSLTERHETPMINFNVLKSWILFLGVVDFSWCLKIRHVGLNSFFDLKKEKNLFSPISGLKYLSGIWILDPKL